MVNKLDIVSLSIKNKLGCFPIIRIPIRLVATGNVKLYTLDPYCDIDTRRPIRNHQIRGIACRGLAIECRDCRLIGTQIPVSHLWRYQYYNWPMVGGAACDRLCIGPQGLQNMAVVAWILAPMIQFPRVS